MAGREGRATEEAAIARSGLESRFQVRRDRDAGPFVLQRIPGGTLTEKRAKKVRFQEFPGRIIDTRMR